MGSHDIRLRRLHSRQTPEFVAFLRAGGFWHIRADESVEPAGGSKQLEGGIILGRFDHVFDCAQLYMFCAGDDSGLVLR